MSGGASAGSAELVLNSASSLRSNACSPPNSFMYSYRSCWLRKLACHAFDSVKSRHFAAWPMPRGSNGSSQRPSLARGRTKPSLRSNTCR